VLLAASALAVLSEGGGVPGDRGRATLELAPNSVAGYPRSGRPGFALPLPGRPTALGDTTLNTIGIYQIRAGRLHFKQAITPAHELLNRS